VTAKLEQFVNVYFTAAEADAGAGAGVGAGAGAAAAAGTGASILAVFCCSATEPAT